MFPEVMMEKEDAAISSGVLQEKRRSSEQMRRSWESSVSWISYAGKKSQAFDMIYWTKIDGRFFREGDWTDRLEPLTAAERDIMDGFC